MANTTLRLPDRIPVTGHALVPAFPGLTFNEPVGLATPPGETNRLFIVERGGIIHVITNLAQPTKTVFLDLSSPPPPGSLESGLLGLAFHPGFVSNRWFFVFQSKYASTPGAPNRLHNVLTRFEVSSGNPHLAQTNSAVTFMAQVDDSDQHNAGDIRFGPDGYLYIPIGERTSRDLAWPDQTPVDRDLQGAILRIDVDKLPGNPPPNPHPASTTHYAIPADNPFLGITQHHGLAVSPSEVRTEIYAMGLRNPWRITFDEATGELYAGDVGEALQEEVNLVVRGGDYGWPYVQGTHLSGYSLPPAFNPIAPLHAYEHGWTGTNGDCVIGGVVYHGTAIPELQGRYLFGDFRSGNLWSLQRQGATSVVERLGGTTIGLTAFGNDPRDGEVLATHLFEGILRLVRVPANEATNLPPTLADAGVFADLTTLTPHAGIVPYEITVPFWSDHAIKSRWFSLPATNLTIGFHPTGYWTFPTGAVWIKHFEMEMTNGVPSSARRLETRVLVSAEDGYYGLTYRWGSSTTNAWLVSEEGEDEHLIIRDANGAILREQDWRYPSRAECMNCHTKWGGYALGFNTGQLHRDGRPGVSATNQIMALSAAGYLTPPPLPAELSAWAAATNEAAPLEFRVRSYLQANCSSCHAPGAHSLAFWDARVSTPLAQSGIISGIGAVIEPGNVAGSRLHQRLRGAPRIMPPIGTAVFNTNGQNLVANWITNLPSAPWSYQSIGDFVYEGGSTLSNNVHRVGGAGLTLQGTNDTFQFMHRPFDQPAAHFIARLVSQNSDNGEARAGLMVREGTDATNRFLMASVQPDGTAALLRRTAPGAAAVSEGIQTTTLPLWLRVARLGNAFNASQSNDGTNWSSLGDTTWTITNALKAGFAVNSGSRQTFNNAVFDQASYLALSLTSSVPPVLPQPAMIPLQAQVESSGRALLRVEFYDGAEKIGEATTEPYSMTVSNAWSGAHDFTALAVDEAGTAIASQPIHLMVQPRPSAAVNPRVQTNYAGNWPGHYGSLGYAIPNLARDHSPAVDFSLLGASSITWEDFTRDPRALLRPGSGNGIASAWTALTTFTVSIQLRDGELRRVSLYCLDWDTANQRVQRVECLDPVSGAVLASHTLSNFSGGAYLVLTLRGNVNLRFTALAGPGATLSGLFFDDAINAPPVVTLVTPEEGSIVELPSGVNLSSAAADSDGTIALLEYYLDGQWVGATPAGFFSMTATNLREGLHTVFARAFDSLGDYSDSDLVVFEAVLPRARAAFVREDATTRGNWLGRYGTEGFLLPPYTNWWPQAFPYATAGTHTYLGFGGEEDFLALPGQTLRIYPLLLGISGITYDLKISDGRPRTVSLYFFDYSNYPVEVIFTEAAGGRVLDSRTVTNGMGGRYLQWSVQGDVQFQIVNILPGAPWPRLGGLFLDPFTNAAPALSLVQPASFLEVTTPATVLLAASADSPDGLRRVEFHSAAKKLGEALEPPYEFLWEFPAAGDHQIFARAISAAGAASDSLSATVRVHYAAVPKVRFVQSDAETGGDWKGIYGRDGYWLPSASIFQYSNLPPTISLVNTQAWTDYGDVGLLRELVRPDSTGRILSFWRDTNTWQFTVRFTDGRAHRISLYNFGPGWTNPLAVVLGPPGSEAALDARQAPNQNIGTYLTWDVQGEVAFTFPATNVNAFVNALFLDPVPNTFDTWQWLHFPPADLLNPAISGATANPDSDPYDNWTEFLLGRNPSAPDAPSPLWLARGTDGTTLHVLVSKAAGPGEVSVEYSSDLVSWTNTSPAHLIGERSRGDQIEQRYQVPPFNQSPLFFRLKLQPAH